MKEQKPTIDYISETASTTECTGLMPTPPLNGYEEDSYEELFSLAINANKTKKEN